MKRQSATTSKSIGSTRSNQVLNSPFAIFQPNQQYDMEQKPRPSILIRTLPFIKRKQTEEYIPNNGGTGNTQELSTKDLEDDNKNEDQQYRKDFIQAEITSRQTGITPTDSRAQSRQQIRYFVHNVGQNFAKSPIHLPPYSQSAKHMTRAARFSTDSQQQQTFSNMAFMTYSQFQSPTQTPLATAYYSTNAEKFSMYHPKNMTQYSKQSQNDQYFEQSPQDSMNESQNINEVKKCFFENFMQESKPVYPNDLPVLSDNQIRDQYTFKFKTDINKLENPNSTIAFLNGFPHNFPLIESHYQAAVKFRDEYNKLKEELRQEIDVMKQKYQKDVEDFQNEAKQISQKIEQEIKEDFVKHQTEQFALNKEITKLTRDKMQLEQDVDAQMRRVRYLEDKLYGQEIFNLEPQDTYIQNMTIQNQRQDTQTPMSTKRQSQIIKNIIH